MKWQAILALALIAAFVPAAAEDTLSPLPSPSPSNNAVEEPALPLLEEVPSNSGPGLLPESGELPALPPAGTPEKLSSTRAPRQKMSGEEERFDEIRSLAMNNPRAAYLLKRARSSSSAVSRRTYLRAYYIAVGSRMRKLDPKLKSSINAYEEAKMHEISGTEASTAHVSSHRSRVHRATTQEGHHHSHRVASEYRHRRMIMIDEADGSQVVLYPW
jgi:Arc/MetJ family transcription regulator